VEIEIETSRDEHQQHSNDYQAAIKTLKQENRELDFKNNQQQREIQEFVS